MDAAARRIRAVTGLAFGCFILIGLGAGVTGVLLPSQIGDYRIDKTTIGLIFFGFSAGYVLAGAAIGPLVHRIGARTTLAAGALAYLAAAAGTGLRPAFAGLIAWQLVMGTGAGLLDAGFNAVLAGLPAATTRLNTLHACYGIGALLGPLLAAGLLARQLPWTAVYLVLTAATAPVLVGVWLRLPATPVDPAPVDPAPADHGPAVGAVLGPAMRYRAVLLAAAFLALYVGIEVSVGNWGYSLLVEVHSQPSLLAGWAVSGYWLGLTLGRLVVNRAAARIGLGPAGLTYGCLAGMIVAAALAWLGPGPATVAGLVLLGFFLGPIFPTAIAVVPRLTPARLVQAAIGVMIGTSVAGGAVFPWLAGALAQRVGLASLLPYVLGLTVVSAWFWSRITRRLAPADRTG
jgi:fucose permease